MRPGGKLKAEKGTCLFSLLKKGGGRREGEGIPVQVPVDVSSNGGIWRTSDSFVTGGVGEWGYA